MFMLVKHDVIFLEPHVQPNAKPGASILYTHSLELGYLPPSPMKSCDPHQAATTCGTPIR